MIRAVIAIAWFGIQTYLASVVFRVLLTAIHPGFADYDHDSVLGLSTLGWACFVAIWLVQLVILAYGMEMVRRYEGFAGPVILLTVAALAGWMYYQANGQMPVVDPRAPGGGEMWQYLCRRRAVAGHLRHPDPQLLRLRAFVAVPQDHPGRQLLGACR